MRLEHFIATVSLRDGQIALPSPELETFYRDVCVPAVKANLPHPRLTDFDLVKGVVMNFVGQMPLKRMLCVGALGVADHLFVSFESYANFSILAGAPKPLLNPKSASISGPFGWNTCSLIDVTPDKLSSHVKTGFSYLMLVASDDRADASLWLRAAAALLVGGGRLILCGHAKIVDELFAEINPQQIDGMTTSASVPLSAGGAFKAMTCTSRNLAGALGL